MAKQTFTTGQVLTAAQVTALQNNGFNQTVTTVTTNYVLLAADVGTRVYMNAAGATTITVNTGVFAAGDTVWLGNINSGACVVTAGTATVDKFSTASLTLSQYQGAYLYFTSTGVAILYSDSAGASIPLTTKGDLLGFDTALNRVPIGTNNQVLTADSAQALGLKWATAASPSASGVMCKLTANTGIANGTATTIDFTTELFDTDAFHDNTTNPSRITIPTGKSGKYLVTASTAWDGIAAGGDRQYRVLKNGALLSGTPNNNWQAVANGTVAQPYVNVFNLVATDYLQFDVVQYSGSTILIQSASTTFGAMFLGA